MTGNVERDKEVDEEKDTHNTRSNGLKLRLRAVVEAFGPFIEDIHWVGGLQHKSER